MAQGENLGDSVTLRKLSAVNSFALHGFVALIVSPIAGLAASLIAVLIFHSRSHTNPVNEWGVASVFLFGPGLLFGLLLNRIALRRAACWVWLLGILWMMFGAAVSLHSYRTRFLGICSPFDSILGGFFSIGSGYCGDRSNFSAFTLPMFSSIAYAIGAWIALRFGRGKDMSTSLVKSTLSS
jgi:hypothetical protein